MMYLIYNSNGSVKYENLVDFIVQGSNDVNKILISIDEHEPTAFSLSGHFVLPDGTITDISSDTTDSVEIDGRTYNGVVLALTSEVTALEGLVRVNIVAKENDTDKVLVTMQTFLTVNSGVSGSEIAIISQAEYNNLLSQIQRNVSNYETILTFIGTFPAPTNYRDGQVIYFVAPGSNMGYLYEKIDGAWVQVFNFKNYYTKDEVYAKSETYNKTEIDSALSGKLDKKTTSGVFVYAHSGSAQTEYGLSASAVEYTVPLRDLNGRLLVRTTDNPAYNEAPSTYYVDSQVATKSTVSGTESDGKWDSLTIDGVTHQVGGSGSYSAGTGIEISGGNEISVDETVVATQSDLQDVREVAEGKCNTIIVDYSTTIADLKYAINEGLDYVYLYDNGSWVNVVNQIIAGNYDSAVIMNSIFNSNNNDVSIIGDNAYLIFFFDKSWRLIKNLDISGAFKTGDIVIVKQLEVPDRWIEQGDPTIFNKLETSKVDLTNYYTKSQTNRLVANDFQETSTYSVGEYVIYDGILYRCVSDISTPGTWNSSYWTAVKVANEMVDKASNQTITGNKTFTYIFPTYVGSNSNRPSYIYANTLDFKSDGKIINHTYNTSYGLSIPNTTGWSVNKEIATTDQTFNVINASDIVSDTLSDEQYALMTNGKPTLIIGTLLGLINPIFLTDNTGTGTRRGFAFSGIQMIAYSINTSTKAIAKNSSSALTLHLNHISEINGKNLPAYPSSTGAFDFVCDSGTLKYVGKGQYDSPTVSSNTAELSYVLINTLSLSADTTLTLATAPASSYPEYKANITNSGASDITITLPSGTAIKGNVSISSNTFVIPSGSTVEVNIQNNKAIVVEW